MSKIYLVPLNAQSKPSNILPYKSIIYIWSRFLLFSLRKFRYLKTRLGYITQCWWSEGCWPSPARAQYSALDVPLTNTSCSLRGTKVLWSLYQLDVSCRIRPVWKIKANHAEKHPLRQKNDSKEISKVQVLMIFWIPAVCMVLRIIKMKTVCHYSQERNVYRFYDNTTKLHRSSWNMDVLICNML